MSRIGTAGKQFMQPGRAVAAVLSLNLAFWATAEAHDPAEPRIIVPDAERHEGAPTPWTSLNVADDPSRFHFAILSDRTGGHRVGVFEKTPDVLNLLQPAFSVSVGDFIEGYTSDRSEISGQWEEIQGLVAQTDAPVFLTPGNHDISNDTQFEDWRRRFGADYYHFIYKNTLFLVLNSQVYPEITASPAAALGAPTAPEEEFKRQMSYVENVLAKNRDVRWTFILLHQPIWNYGRTPGSAPGWERLKALLGDRPHTLFAGHTHIYEHAQGIEHGHDRITLASTGGDSRMRGIEYGEFDHIAWVTMTEKGPVIANVLLDGVLPRDIPVAKTLSEARELTAVVRARPFTVDTDRFSSGRQFIRLNNPTQSNVAVNGVFRASRNLVAEPASYTAILKPGESRNIPVRLRAVRPTPVESIAAIDGHWEIARAGRNGNEFRIESVTALLPERTYQVPTDGKDISVDGRLSDWGGAEALRFRGASEITDRENFFGEDDLTFSFDMKIHGDSLYIAVNVVDDDLALDPKEGLTNRDFVRIHLDMRESAQLKRNLPLFQELLLQGAERQFLENFLYLSIGPGKEGTADPGDDLLNRLWMRFWPGVAAAAHVRDDGYSVEILVPFKGKRPANADAGGSGEIRFNLMVNDVDNRKQRSEHFWRTSRFHEFGHPQAGIMKFTRGPGGHRSE